MRDLQIATDEQLARELFARFFPDREENIHLKDSHKRWLKVLKEFNTYKDLVGLAKKTIQEFSFKGPSDIVLIRNIRTSCLCPHHLLPVSLKIDFAYLPSNEEYITGNCVGLSKIPRFIKILSKQPITQEDLSDLITHTFMQSFVNLSNNSNYPYGCMCIITGVHNCMTCRGIESRESDVITSSIKGKAFEDLAARTEVLELLKR